MVYNVHRVTSMPIIYFNKFKGVYVLLINYPISFNIYRNFQ